MGMCHDREKILLTLPGVAPSAAAAPPNAMTPEKVIHHYHFMLRIGRRGQAQSPL